MNRVGLVNLDRYLPGYLHLDIIGDVIRSINCQRHSHRYLLLNLVRFWDGDLIGYINGIRSLDWNLNLLVCWNIHVRCVGNGNRNLDRGVNIVWLIDIDWLRNVNGVGLRDIVRNSDINLYGNRNVNLIRGLHVLGDIDRFIHSYRNWVWFLHRDVNWDLNVNLVRHRISNLNIVGNGDRLSHGVRHRMRNWNLNVLSHLNINRHRYLHLDRGVNVIWLGDINLLGDSNRNILVNSIRDSHRLLDWHLHSDLHRHRNLLSRSDRNRNWNVLSN